MARVSTTEGGYGGGASVIHTDSSHSEYVSVPDADLLFRGDYHRAGPDLVLTGHDGSHHIVPGYFASEKHAALVAPNGASLSADVVDLLAGSAAPGQYAQAQPTAPPDSIGKVEKVVGDVTVVRNGVSVALHVGDAVFKSDVIATGSDSSAGISFPDGTVLDLVANSRMALNEYSFEPNGANNGAVFTLVEGTFGFVAGQVAQDNHMSVVTPVATMGIRGTAGIVRHEFRANAGDLLYSFLVLDEVDIRRHGHHVGAYEVRDNRPDSPTFGEILQLIADSGYVTSVEAQGSGLPPIVTTEPITNSRLFSDRPILQDLVDSYGQFNGPGGIHSPGSGDSPNLLFGPQFLPENGGGNPINFVGVTPTGGTNINAATTSITTPPPEAPSSPVIAVPAPTQTLVINTAGAISGVNVSETNSTSGETFTVTLSDNNGVLSANTSATGGGGTITSTNSGHVLTIVGTLSQVNADLTTLTDNDTTPGTDKITVTATDSLGHSAAPATINVTVLDTTTVSDALPASLSGNENTAIALSEANAITVSDTPNTGDVLQTMLTVSHGTITVDTLDGTTVVGGANGSGSVTLSGTAAQITAALASANYTGNSNYYGPDSLVVTTTDTVNGATTGPQTVGITLADTTTVSDALPASLSGNENTAIALSEANAITVSDTPNTGDVLQTMLTVSHGTITVDTLDGTTVVGGANGSGSVTLSGTAAQITAALASANYTGNSNYYGPDSLVVTTTDTVNGATTGPQTVGITLADTTTVSDALPASLSGNENTAIALSEANAITVSDTPNTGDVLQTMLTVSHGTITVDTLDGTTVVGGANGSGSVTLSGTAAQITAALASANYTGNSNYYGPDSLVVTTTDTVNGATTGPQTVGITLADTTTVSDALPASLSGNENTAIALSEANAITVSDTPNTGDVLQTMLTVSHGTITVDTLDGTTVVGGANGSGSVTLSGTAAQITAALASANYTGNSNYYGPDSLVVTTTDTVNGATTGPQTVGITLADTTTVSDALPASLSGNENTAIALSEANAITVSDTPNTGDVLQTMLTVSHGTITVDTLDGTTVVGGANGSGSVTLSGTAAQITAALASANYTGNSNYYGPDSLVVTTTDTVNGATTGPQTVGITLADTTTVSDALPASLSGNENTAIALSEANAITVSDTPNTGDVLQTMLTVSHGTITVDTLDGTTVVGGANGSGSVTLSGTAAQITAALASANYTGNSNYYGPDSLVVTTTDTVNGATTGPQTVGITLADTTTVSDALPASLSGNENTAIALSEANAITVSDTPNTGDVLQTMLTVSHGTITVDTLDGTTVVGGANGSGSVTLSGTAAQITAALASANYTGNSNYYGPDSLVVTTTDTVNGATTGPQTVGITLADTTTVSDALPASLSGNENTAIALSEANAITVSDTPNTGDVLQTMLTVSHGTITVDTLDGTTVVGGANGSGSVTLSGTAAQITAALASANYTGNSNYYGPDSLVVTTTDTVNGATTGPQTVGITLADTTTVSDALPASLSGNENTAIALSEANAITVSDTPNTGDVLQTMLTVSHGTITVDTLDGTTVVGGANGSGSVTLSGTAAQITAALASANYTGNSNYYGPDSLVVTTTDTVNGATTGPQTVGITLADTTTVSDALPASLSGNENTAIALSEANAITVSDTPNTGDVLQTMLTVSHGTITVDTLDGTTVVGGANGSGSVTLSGTAAQITAALASANYTGNSNYYGPDSLVVTTTDTVNGATTGPQTVGITLADTTTVSDALPASLSGNENTAIALSEANAITVSDTPNTGDVLQTMLTVSHGTITVDTLDGTTVVGGANGSGSVTLSGTAAQITAALASANYTGNSNYYGPDSLVVTTTDTVNGATTGPQTVGITLADTTTVSDALPASLSGNENTAIALSEANAITVSDTPNTGDVLQTMLTVSHGTITVDTLDGTTVVGGANGSGSVTLSGTAAQITAALASANYTGNSNYYGPDSLVVTTTDTVNGATTGPQTVGITLADTTTVSDALPASLSGNENTAIALSEANAITVSDTPNTGDVLQTMLTVSHGTITVDTLDGTTVVGGANGSGSVTLSGTAAQITAALASANYTGNSNYYGPDSLVVTTTDTVNGATTGPQTVGITLADTTTVSETVSALTAPVNLVTNGSFETDNFTGWTLGGNLKPFGNSATVYVNGQAESGSFAAALGSVGSDGTLSQTLQTTAGQQYTFSFWLANNNSGPDDFTAKWNGTPVFALTNASAQGYTEHTFTVIATGSTSTLEFDARQDPSHWSLDNISVIPVGAETSLKGFVSVSDSPNIDDTLTTTLTVLYGKITVAAPSGAIIGGDDSGSVTLTGTAAEINAALATASYIPTPGYDSDSLTVTTTDPSSISSNNTVTQTVAIAVTSGTDGPAGVAGSPINLALANPAAANGTSVTVTITGVPSEWSLNEGTNLGNGTWTVQTNDLSALTVMTAAAYSGAMVLGVTETWTNANGSTGSAFVSDNVEAYAPGAPIFALSANDTLTGAGGNDEFVFAQPIGNDTIYNFNVATDKIDLMGFAKIASFTDIQANIVEDSSGDAVITIGAGETITLHDVNAASLTAADFVFNQTPVVTNAGNMVVSDGAVLPLSGTIDNTGAIGLNSSGDHTELQIIGGGVTLEGGGQLTLSDSSANAIVGTGPNDTLTNVDNTISGAGQIGSGDGTLTLVNEVHGIIEANDAGGTLTLETGTTITNNGVMEALNGGTLQILDPVIGSGSAIIAGGTMIFDAQSNMNVTFNNGPNGTTYGELVLGDASGFSGQIAGFTGNAPDPAHSDAIDLVGINYDSSAFSETYNASNSLLTVTDGTHAASVTFDNFNGTLSFASDGNGGTLITDPAATGGSNTSVSVGGPGNDTFVFQPGIGAETIGHFNPWADTLELDHFANVQTIQQLAALIGTDAHGDAVIELGHNDSITLPGVTQSYLQAHLQSLVHLG